MLAAFWEQKTKAVSKAFNSNLRKNDLVSWIEADAEALVMQHLRNEIVASVENGKPSDTGNDSMNNSDDSSKSVVQTLINETLIKWWHGWNNKLI
jgi:hypothetical protein